MQNLNEEGNNVKEETEIASEERTDPIADRNRRRFADHIYWDLVAIQSVEDTLIFENHTRKISIYNLLFTISKAW